jgi:hypothetical protein
MSTKEPTRRDEETYDDGRQKAIKTLKAFAADWRFGNRDLAACAHFLARAVESKTERDTFRLLRQIHLHAIDELAAGRQSLALELPVGKNLPPEWSN